MSERQGKILLVEDDAPTLDALRRLLLRDGKWRVEAASDATAGMALARPFLPDVIVSDYEMPGTNGFEFCQKVKANPALATALFIVLSAHNDTTLKVEGLRLGVDDFITKPIEASELLAKVDAHLRLKRLHDALREDKGRLQARQGKLTLGFEQLLSVLRCLLDLRIPGAEARGDRLGKWALKLAACFGVPEGYLDDLTQGAMLHEIGKVITTTERRPAPTTPAPLSDRPVEWAYTAASRAILQRVDYLEDTADLVGVIYENWDGTGHPNRWRKGQIPLRARILRVLIDFFSVLGDDRSTVTSNDTAKVIKVLSRYSGTWYDPLVLEHLTTLVAEEPEACLLEPKYRLPVSELEEGMVLAADLMTISGVKLLADGSTLTARTLDVVLQRHKSDPIVEGAWVER